MENRQAFIWLHYYPLYWMSTEIPLFLSSLEVNNNICEKVKAESSYWRLWSLIRKWTTKLNHFERLSNKIQQCIQRKACIWHFSNLFCISTILNSSFWLILNLWSIKISSEWPSRLVNSSEKTLKMFYRHPSYPSCQIWKSKELQPPKYTKKCILHWISFKLSRSVKISKPSKTSFFRKSPNQRFCKMSSKVQEKVYLAKLLVSRELGPN